MLKKYTSKLTKDLDNQIIEFDYFYKDNLCAHVYADLKKGKVTQELYTSEKWRFPMQPGRVNIEELFNFFEERLVERDREGIQRLLDAMHLDFFDTYEMCKITHGRMYTDHLWIRFKGETCTWKDMYQVMA